MGLTRPYRALAPPAVAIVVSSAFIATLGTGWLAVERKAARLRGAEAAAAPKRACLGIYPGVREG